MEDLTRISKGKMWQKLIYFSHNLPLSEILPTISKAKVKVTLGDRIYE
jgi:hypothetical protein